MRKDKTVYLESKTGVEQGEKKMTIFEKIKGMNIDELAHFFANGKYPNFPHSPCYICKYDDGFNCLKPDCDDEHKKQVYKEWLEREAKTDE